MGTTSKLELNKPAEGDTEWANPINQNWETLDDAVVPSGDMRSGDIAYDNGLAWARLAKGTDGQFLKLVSGLPAWADLTAGKVSKVIDHTWEGDNTNNRTIDLGDDYDFIMVFLEETGDTRFHMAFAFKNWYAVHRASSSAGCLYMYNMSDGNSDWQGKMTGADANKVKCGSDGTRSNGTNKSGWTYRLIGFKFSSME